MIETGKRSKDRMEGWRNCFDEAYTGKQTGGRGLAVPKRKISSVMRVIAGGQGFIVPETNSATTVKGEVEALLSEFVAVACLQRSGLELGRARMLLFRKERVC